MSKKEESKDLLQEGNPKVAMILVSVVRARLEKNQDWCGSMKPGVTVSQGFGRKFHYEAVEDGGRRPKFTMNQVELPLHEDNLKNSQVLKFVIEDDQKDDCFKKGTTDKRYIGTAYFNLISDFDMADEDPTKFPYKDSQFQS